jgi:hypothetical protein
VTAPDDAMQARDVIAFGQEAGRMLSDGRVVGRAEPYAKVFTSSRAVKRAVGLVAWAILEDIALDARIDDQGRLVAEHPIRIGPSRAAACGYAPAPCARTTSVRTPTRPPRRRTATEHRR